MGQQQDATVAVVASSSSSVAQQMVQNARNSALKTHADLRAKTQNNFIEMNTRAQAGTSNVKEDLRRTKTILLEPFLNAGNCIGDLFNQIDVIATEALNNIDMCAQHALSQINVMEEDGLQYIESISDQIMEIEKIIATCEASAKFQFEINLCVFGKVSGFELSGYRFFFFLIF